MPPYSRRKPNSDSSLSRWASSSNDDIAGGFYRRFARYGPTSSTTGFPTTMATTAIALGSGGSGIGGGGGGGGVDSVPCAPSRRGEEKRDGPLVFGSHRRNGGGEEKETTEDVTSRTARTFTSSSCSSSSSSFQGEHPSSVSSAPTSDSSDYYEDTFEIGMDLDDDEEEEDDDEDDDEEEVDDEDDDDDGCDGYGRITHNKDDNGKYQDEPILTNRRTSSTFLPPIVHQSPASLRPRFIPPTIS